MPEPLIVLPPLGRVPAGIHGTGRKVARIALVTLLIWVGLVGLAWYVLDRIAAAPPPGVTYDEPPAARQPGNDL
ncbi:hypothetical protein [Oceanibacterium hippocampi]|uniref:Uncharacterized protein n=1 Tax=Oceanibacterium hippocampi TaxID=745714 RepID=A0A1Y5U5C4_9PROT|nr:hypothetical protein [Oceanibacterium hippocampi]SLN77540.1 hypothetical protein OCH7691_04451 [Oceanibacterium hippocampi]